MTKTELREQIKFVFNGGKPEPGQITPMTVSETGLDKIMALIDSFHTQEVEQMLQELKQIAEDAIESAEVSGNSEGCALDILSAIDRFTPPAQQEKE